MPLDYFTVTSPFEVPISVQVHAQTRGSIIWCLVLPPHPIPMPCFIIAIGVEHRHKCEFIRV